MITSEIKTISNCRKELRIVMEKDDLNPIREQETQRVRKEVQFPGFRKGKAPLHMVKRSYGQAIEAYTMESAVQQAVEKAVADNNLEVVGMPEPKKVDFNEDGNLDMTIEVDTYPEVALKKYQGFDFIKDRYTIEDSFVEEQIKRLLKSRASRKETDGPVAEGHIIQMDMQELDESGAPLVGKKYQDITVSVGDGRFDPDLEKQLIGLKKGKETKITKEYPKDFPQKEYAGKKESYNITVKKIEEEKLPELTDEFVKEINPNVNSADEFRDQMRRNLQAEYEREAQNRFGTELTQKLIEENNFDVPEALIDNYLNHVVRDVRQRDPNAKEEQIRQHYRTDAEFNIKWYYLKEKIADAEGIKVEEEDVKKFLDEIENDEVRQLYEKNDAMMSNVKESLKDKKILEFLEKKNKVKENEIKLD